MEKTFGRNKKVLCGEKNRAKSQEQHEKICERSDENVRWWYEDDDGEEKERQTPQNSRLH